MHVQPEYGGPLFRTPALLYQRSYLEEPEYISERCSKCFDQAIIRERSRGRVKKSVHAASAPEMTTRG